MTAAQVLKDLKANSNPAQALNLARFFKTAPGQYGYGDKFLGLKVPQTRALIKPYLALPLNEIEKLLASPYHEARLAGVMILVRQYETAVTATEQKRLYNFYFSHTTHINNWDLVDTSAHYIVGHHLHGKPKTPLYKLAKSKSLWERRIAMVATFYDIQEGEPEIALNLATKLLHDTHDLMHKAVGWMLREVGKRCGREHLTQFLDQHAATMPRTALRYAIEHLSAPQKQYYMSLGKKA
jgi:3-methyladenine DNA glycosylase AlkD